MRNIRGHLRTNTKQSKPVGRNMLVILARLNELIVFRLANLSRKLIGSIVFRAWPLRHGCETARRVSRMNENSLRDDPIAHVRRAMEVITADGRCAGHVSQCAGGQIYLVQSNRPIPKEWIRKVDRQDVYISKRLSEIAHLRRPARPVWEADMAANPASVRAVGQAHRHAGRTRQHGETLSRGQNRV
jgi:hypothetical protein